MTKPLPEIEYLESLFDYCADSGVLTRIKSGKEIRSNLRGGYMRVTINGESYYAHRICWKLFYDREPDQIDHIDGDGSNNKITSLREADQKENMRNRCLNKNNTSGVTGVSLGVNPKKWVAQIRVNKKQIHLGSFDNKEEAVKARKEAEIEYGYHENHGRAAAHAARLLHKATKTQEEQKGEDDGT